jgi:23S rRNA (guanosine2251-2'-O)-methyltransferase
VAGHPPRDRVITLYGRMPVLEALLDPRAAVSRVVVAHRAEGGAIDRITAAAAARRVPVERADAARVTRLSGNGRHDQGVVADVASPGLQEVGTWLAAGPAGPAALLVLDGVTNPANVGLVIRSAVAAGLDGVVLPRAGVPAVGPLVVKASAGVALSATILQAATAADAVDAVAAAGFAAIGLTPGAGEDLWHARLPGRVALVLGGETSGISPEVASRLVACVRIPLAAGVDSLNVAVAGSLAAFELARRRTVTP